MYSNYYGKLKYRDYDILKKTNPQQTAVDG